MNTVINGVLKDRRTVLGYQHWANQPFVSKAYWKGCKRYISHNSIKAMNAVGPIYISAFFCLPFMFTSLLYRYFTAGHKPQ